MDYYLKAASQEVIDAALGDLLNEEGMPADNTILVDRIGDIGDSSDYHLNLRLLGEPTEDQAVALEAVTITPPNTPYRVWA